MSSCDNNQHHGEQTSIGTGVSIEAVPHDLMTPPWRENCETKVGSENEKVVVKLGQIAPISIVETSKKRF